MLQKMLCPYMQIVVLCLHIEVSVASEYLWGRLSLEQDLSNSSVWDKAGSDSLWHEGVKIVESEGSAFLDLASFYPCTQAISILASKDFFGALDEDKAVPKASKVGWVCGGCGSWVAFTNKGKGYCRSATGKELSHSHLNVGNHLYRVIQV